MARKKAKGKERACVALRERVEAIGGSVRRDVSTGQRLSIRLPASLVAS